MAAERIIDFGSFIEGMKRTEGPTDIFKLQFHQRLLHGVLGCVTEAGELADAVKRTFAYGKPLDKTNLIEELGDMMWYIALICDTLEVPLGKVLEVNTAKLSKRYPEKFTNQEAINRDVTAERKVLDGEFEAFLKG